ncbi:hypothetical protein MTR67_019637 [Solanum verrucosum]|uniref:Uncharacterized protein n=1 Tax=Solanum verrucosum TaxID=315347 RepID=A0AAF0QP40_SOLVR|nr:hypothetical protein MTR67_019637 [Solanum verrucosum]
MKKWGMNGKTWRFWRSERRGAPTFRPQRGLFGALLGAPPQGLDFRVPFGAHWLARRPSLFLRKFDSSPFFFQL